MIGVPVQDIHWRLSRWNNNYTELNAMGTYFNNRITFYIFIWFKRGSNGCCCMRSPCYTTKGNFIIYDMENPNSGTTPPCDEAYVCVYDHLGKHLKIVSYQNSTCLNYSIKSYPVLFVIHLREMVFICVFSLPETAPYIVHFLGENAQRQYHGLPQMD